MQIPTLLTGIRLWVILAGVAGIVAWTLLNVAISSASPDLLVLAPGQQATNLAAEGSTEACSEGSTCSIEFALAQNRAHMFLASGFTSDAHGDATIFRDFKVSDAASGQASTITGVVEVDINRLGLLLAAEPVLAEAAIKIVFRVVDLTSSQEVARELIEDRSVSGEVTFVKIAPVPIPGLEGGEREARRVLTVQFVRGHVYRLELAVSGTATFPVTTIPPLPATVVDFSGALQDLSFQRGRIAWHNLGIRLGTDPGDEIELLRRQLEELRAEIASLKAGFTNHTRAYFVLRNVLVEPANNLVEETTGPPIAGEASGAAATTPSASGNPPLGAGLGDTLDVAESADGSGNGLPARGSPISPPSYFPGLGPDAPPEEAGPTKLE